ncbi:MAG: hypothetical protein KF777_17275 [Planctomycetaceae bacterium]|nr:hypothetical protein [Planctomycetaceae bacterium]
MSRMTVPTPTRPPAPSHSPPDMHYQPGVQLARKLGWFSIGLGLAEVFCTNDVARVTGIRNRQLLTLYGLREIATGVGLLMSQRPAPWLWARVVGDGLDMAALGTVLSEGDEDRRSRAMVSMLAVAGVTALDAATASTLTAARRLEG